MHRQQHAHAQSNGHLGRQRTIIVQRPQQAVLPQHIAVDNHGKLLARQAHCRHEIVQGRDVGLSGVVKAAGGLRGQK